MEKKKGRKGGINIVKTSPPMEKTFSIHVTAQEAIKLRKIMERATTEEIDLRLVVNPNRNRLFVYLD